MPIILSPSVRGETTRRNLRMKSRMEAHSFPLSVRWRTKFKATTFAKAGLGHRDTLLALQNRSSRAPPTAILRKVLNVGCARRSRQVTLWRYAIIERFRVRLRGCWLGGQRGVHHVAYIDQAEARLGRGPGSRPKQDQDQKQDELHAESPTLLSSLSLFPFLILVLVAGLGVPHRGL